MNTVMVVSAAVVLLCLGFLYFLLAPHIHDWLRVRRQAPFLALCAFLQKEFAQRPLIKFLPGDGFLDVEWDSLLGAQNDPSADIRAALDDYENATGVRFKLQPNTCNCNIARILRL